MKTTTIICDNCGCDLKWRPKDPVLTVEETGSYEGIPYSVSSDLCSLSCLETWAREMQEKKAASNARS